MEPQTITSREFLAHFCDDHREDKRFCFILGAGASKSSGIPTGAELVNAWCDDLRKMHGDDWVASWFEADKIDGKNLAAFYPKIYKKRYQFDPKDGYAFLEKLMNRAGVDPSSGYAVLAWILTRENEKSNIVITTNFDSLTEDALFIYTRKKPLVVGHESLAHFINPNSTRPLVVKIHRDLLLSPKNSEGELDELPKAFVDGLQLILKQATPIVVGYGGNDGTLMGLLEKLSPVDGGMFWCYREVDGVPSERIRNVVSRHYGWFVTVSGFDELMIQLGNKFEMLRQDGEVLKIANDRAKRYTEQIKRLSKDEGQDAETAEAIDNIVDRTVEKSGEKDWFYYEQLARKQKTVEEKEVVYKTGLEQIPNSPELLSRYAVFLHVDKNNIAGAEEYYLKALTVDPKNVIILNNYAVLLRDEKKDILGAEKYYLQAIAADPKHARIYGSYAVFLRDLKKDIAGAEEYYQKALTANPKDSWILSSYAKFLIMQDKIDQSLHYLRQSFKHFGKNQNDDKDEIDLWFMAYAIFYKEYPGSREKIEQLLAKGVRSPGWNLKGVLEVAKKHGHPDFEKLCEFERLITAPSEE